MLSAILIGTLISWGVSFLPQLMFVTKNPKLVTTWGVVGLIGNLILNSLLVYFFLPAMTGPLGGYQYLWPTLLINAVFCGAVWMAKSDSRDDDSTFHFAGGAGATVAFVLLLLVVFFIHWANNWNQDSADAKVKFANVTTVTEQMPGTDPNHAPIVSNNVAINRGKGSVPQNLGSIYHPGSFTLQKLAGGRQVRIAPLVYNNFMANLQYPTTPGYIEVDAEDPSAQPVFVPYEFTYIPEAILDQDLLRHMYLSGYSDVLLVDPTVEVDDAGKIYYTVGLGQYFQGLTGVDIQSMAMIDVQSGDITVCNVGECPDWLDRVIPDEIADQFVSWYGQFGKASWFNFLGMNNANREMPADDVPAQVYNADSQHVSWQFVMTSVSYGDNTGIGVVLCDSSKRQCTYYKLDKTFPVGSQVDATIESSTKNTIKYVVDQKILTMVDGQLTWIATMVSGASTSTGSGGAQFQKVAFLAASSTVSGDAVQWGDTLDEALRNYRAWLQNRGSNEVDINTTATIETLEGYIVGLGSTTRNGSTFHMFYIRGMNGEKQMVTVGDKLEERVFYAYYSTDLLEMPFVQVGHHVVVTYEASNSVETPLKSFDDLDVPPIP